MSLIDHQTIFGNADVRLARGFWRSTDCELNFRRRAPDGVGAVDVTCVGRLETSEKGRKETQTREGKGFTFFR
jgi:hypothetical protein